MAHDGHTTLTLHGLNGDNKLVRADVFARKLQALIAGLRAADKFANGKHLHRYVIERLEIGSAVACVREKQATKQRPQHSSIAMYETAVTSVYNGGRAIETFPQLLLRQVKALTSGAEKTFAHGEVCFEQSNIVRIDEFLARQSERAVAVVGRESAEDVERFYRGLAIGSFDGVLQVMDSRGEVLRATLVTTAGSIELDCVINKSRIPEVKNLFEQRVRIEGMAHYDGVEQLPVRIDVASIKLVKENPDLSRWRGAFDRRVNPRDDW